MTMIRPEPRSDGFIRQAKDIAQLRGFGRQHPGGEARDTRFIDERTRGGPIEGDVLAPALFEFLDQQCVVTRAGLPCDRTARIAGMVVAQHGKLVAGAFRRDLGGGIVGLWQWRRTDFDLRINQRSEVRIDRL